MKGATLITIKAGLGSMQFDGAKSQDNNDDEIYNNNNFICPINNES